MGQGLVGSGEPHGRPFGGIPPAGYVDGHKSYGVAAGRLFRQALSVPAIVPPFPLVPPEEVANMTYSKDVRSLEFAWRMGSDALGDPNGRQGDAAFKVLCSTSVMTPDGYQGRSWIADAASGSCTVAGSKGLIKVYRPLGPEPASGAEVLDVQGSIFPVAGQRAANASYTTDIIDVNPGGSQDFGIPIYARHAWPIVNCPSAVTADVEVSAHNNVGTIVGCWVGVMIAGISELAQRGFRVMGPASIIRISNTGMEAFSVGVCYEIQP